MEDVLFGSDHERATVLAVVQVRASPQHAAVGEIVASVLKRLKIQHELFLHRAQGCGEVVEKSDMEPPVETSPIPGGWVEVVKRPLDDTPQGYSSIPL